MCWTLDVAARHHSIVQERTCMHTRTEGAVEDPEKPPSTEQQAVDASEQRLVLRLDARGKLEGEDGGLRARRVPPRLVAPLARQQGAAAHCDDLEICLLD